MRAIWRPPVCSFQSCFVRAGPPNTHCNRPLNLVPNSRHSDCVSSLDHKGFAANPAAADFFRYLLDMFIDIHKFIMIMCIKDQK